MTDETPTTQNNVAREVHQISQKLDRLSQTLTAHDVRLSVLEQNHALFQDTIIKRLDHRESHQRDLYKGMAKLREEISFLPDKVSKKVTDCRAEIDKDLKKIEDQSRDLYATKAEVITPVALRNILLIVTVVASALFAAVKYIDHEFSDYGEADNARMDRIEKQLRDHDRRSRPWNYQSGPRQLPSQPKEHP